MFPFGLMKRAALILVGRFRSGAAAEADASYGAVAVEDTTRELMALAQLRLRDIVNGVDVDAAADASGRLLIAEGLAIATVKAQAELSTTPDTSILTPGAGTEHEDLIILANNNAANAAVVLTIGNAANGTRLHVETILAGATIHVTGPIPLTSAQTLKGSSSVAGVTITVVGRRVL